MAKLRVVIEIVWSTKLRIFTIWFSTEKGIDIGEEGEFETLKKFF